MIFLSGHIANDLEHPRLGFIMTPRMGNSIPETGWLAADTGCFSAPHEYSDDRYLRFIDRFPRGRMLFATAPDVLGDHVATVERSHSILKKIRQLGIAAAFVAQDGWGETSTPWEDLDVLFVGGTTEFKYRGGRDAVLAAKRHGKRAHMGRANSHQKLRAAWGIGCESADGTFLRFGPHTNRGRLFRWFDLLDQRGELA